MRTTVRLDDALLAEAKAFAARHHRTLTSVLEDALRQLLHQHATVTERPPVVLDVYTGDGLLPGVDVDSSARLHEALDDGQAAAYGGRGSRAPR